MMSVLDLEGETGSSLFFFGFFVCLFGYMQPLVCVCVCVSSYVCICVGERVFFLWQIATA